MTAEYHKRRVSGLEGGGTKHTVTTPRVKVVISTRKHGDSRFYLDGHAVARVWLAGLLEYRIEEAKVLAERIEGDWEERQRLVAEYRGTLVRKACRAEKDLEKARAALRQFDDAREGVE